MADADTTDSSADPKATPAARKKAAERQKIMVGVGIAGLALTFILLRRDSSSTAATTTAATPTSTSDYGDSGTGSSDMSSALSGLESTDSEIVAELTAMQAAGVGSTSTTTVVPTSQASLATESVVGGGYSPPTTGTGFASTVTTAAGNTFNWVETGPQAIANEAADTQMYYQPSPGTFAPVPAGAISSNGGWMVNGTPVPLYTAS